MSFFNMPAMGGLLVVACSADARTNEDSTTIPKPSTDRASGESVRAWAQARAAAELAGQDNRFRLDVRRNIRQALGFPPDEPDQ
jgi:hypothetical protein